MIRIALGAAAALTVLTALPEVAGASWWSERFQVHGFFTTKLYGRSPSLDVGEELVVSSWRTELNLETELDVHDGELFDRRFRVGLYGVFRPIYDAVYELNPDTWGEGARGSRFDPETLGAETAFEASLGDTFPGHGECVDGEFCLGNADTGSLFTDQLEPALVIDDVVFFGAVTAPVHPFGESNAPYPLDRVGGNATGDVYRLYLDSSLRREAGNVRLTNNLVEQGFPRRAARNLARGFVETGEEALDASLTPMGSFTDAGLPGRASRPVGTPLNAYAGAVGSRSSLNEQAPFDVNRNENRLKFDCRDNAHPSCFVRELYADIDWGDTWMRIGRQQIVWGKTDAFRLQDNINPVDLGYHNIFPDLEERRIPQLSLDVIHSFRDVGPLQDLSLELVWIFDRFRPLQFGQCGEPYAFTLACQGRADAAAHSIFNFGLAGVEEVDWKLSNTEPGVRVEFRLPKPSVSVSLSAFYGHQDLPVARFRNRYSVDNPNPATMLFLQGLGVGSLINSFAGRSTGSPWTEGFDPYAKAPDGTPQGSLAEANEVLLEAWRRVFNEIPQSAGGCADATGSELAECANTFLPFALPWTASEYELTYPRVLTLGASLDYQVPRWDTIFRLEMAADLDRGINNTAKADGVDSSDVFLAAIGIDRPTYIPFLNPDRTAFLSFQTFFEHVVDYDDAGFGNGMVVPETQIISTFVMDNFWRNDSIVLRTFVAYDWNARAWAGGPSLRWFLGQNLILEGGINVLFGGADHVHNVRDLCADGTLGCLGDPTSWNPGQWQTLNEDVQRFSRAPWWARQGFADDFMEDRDEIWVGLTYQF